MKRFYTIAILLLISSSLFSQKLDYDNDSRWFWGLNAGAAWNTTDVKNKTNLERTEHYHGIKPGSLDYKPQTQPYAIGSTACMVEM